MKRSILVLSLILLLAACSEPKMKLRAPEQKSEKKEATVQKKDSVATVKP